MVVLDEIHVYRGVFGAHVRWVIYRLSRLAGGAQFIGAGATIGDPEGLGERLFGVRPRVVRGPRGRGSLAHIFVDAGGASRWAVAASITAVLASRGYKVLAFVDSQQMSERVAGMVKGLGVEAGVHRAGLPAEYRRSVEERFREGAIRVVVATPTMELGLDIGDLDVVVMASPPRSYSSYLQRAGRAGRRGRNILND